MNKYDEKSGSKSVTARVTVNVPAPTTVNPTGISLSKNSITLTKKGATKTLKATIEPSNSNNVLIYTNSVVRSLAIVGDRVRIGSTATVSTNARVLNDAIVEDGAVAIKSITKVVKSKKE